MVVINGESLYLAQLQTDIAGITPGTDLGLTNVEFSGPIVCGAGAWTDLINPTTNTSVWIVFSYAVGGAVTRVQLARGAVHTIIYDSQLVATVPYTPLSIPYVIAATDKISVYPTGAALSAEIFLYY